MAEVRFYELSSTPELRAMENAINLQLRSVKVCVSLTRDQSGEIGYAISQITADRPEEVLEIVDRTVRQVVGRSL